MPGSNPLRTKNITLTVNPTITKWDYIVASASAAAITIGFCISYVVTIIIFNIREGRKLAQEPMNEESQDINEQSPSTVGEVTIKY